MAAPRAVPGAGGGGTGSSVPSLWLIAHSVTKPHGDAEDRAGPGGSQGSLRWPQRPLSVLPGPRLLASASPREPRPDRDAGRPPRAQQEALGGSCGERGHTASCPPMLAPPPLASMSTLRPASPEVQVAGWGHHPRRALGQASYGCAGLCRSPSVCSGTRGIAGSAENCSGLHPLSWGQAQEPRQGHGCSGWRTGPGAERPVVKPRLCPAALSLDLPIRASGHQHEVLPRCRAHDHPCGQH